MAERKWQAMVLGRLPEAEKVLASPLFSDALAVEFDHVRRPERFEAALRQRPTPDVIVIDIQPHGLEVLDQVREIFPVAPVIMVGDPACTEELLEALRQGLERFVLRVGDTDIFVRLLSQVIYRLLSHSIEPPSLDKPSAEQMHRYAQYHHILHPFYVTGPDRRLLYVNAAAERLTWKMLGRSPVIGEVVGDELFASLGDPFAEQLREALAGDESAVMYSFDGLEPPAERGVHLTPVVTRSGRTVAVSIAVHSEVPPEVERARTMRAIGRFAGGLAHDFNNLLNVMMVQTELLEAQLGDIPKAARRCIQSMSRAVADGGTLTRQLLAISQEALTRAEPVHLDTLLTAYEPHLRQCLQPGQTLTLETEEFTPLVQGDPEQLEHLVTRLVENAAEALDEGGHICVRTAGINPSTLEQVPRGLEKRPWLVLSVADTGPGVRPALHTKVFEPFFTTRRAEGHSGLGLTLVHAVVERMGGRIFVDSEPGEGCTFTVYLPAKLDGDDARTGEAPASEHAVQGRQWGVLLVEDEDDLRHPFREALVQRGFAVLEASNADQARQIIEDRSDDIDLLVTDVVMPGGSGVALARELYQRHPDIKLVFVSGYTADVVEDDGAELTVDYTFLAKPVSMKQLVKTVDELLGADHAE